MFTVIITEKGGESRRSGFDKLEVTIGRVQGNDIVLPKGNVSKRHSRIVLKDGKFIIADLKSTNGTYVNGRKIVNPQVLRDTDKVYIGDYILSVEGAGASERAPEAPAFAAPPVAPPPAPRAAPPAAPVVERVAAALPSAPTRRPPAPRPAPIEEIEELDDDGVEEQEQEQEVAAPRAVAPAARAAAPREPAPREPAPREPMPAPVREPMPALAREPREPMPALAREPYEAPRVAPRVEAPPMLRPPQPPAPVEPKPREPEVRAATTEPATFRPSGRAAVVSAPSVAAPAAAPAAVHVASEPSVRVAGGSLVHHARAVHELHDRLAAQLELARVPLERLGEESLRKRAETALVDLIEQLDAEGGVPSDADQDLLTRDVLDEVLGLGPLQALLADAAVDAVIVNRPDQVFVERAGRLEASGRMFSSDKALRQVLSRLAARAVRKIDDSAPIIDVRLGDGSRLTAVTRTVSTRGACLTLRKARRSAESLDALVAAGALTMSMARFLGACLEARRNLLVVGGATSGKTALVGALASALSPAERIISVEEVAELALPQHGWIALEADLRGGASFSDMLAAALRLRPDRLVVGEVAGAETYALACAMASGHDGTITSVTANSTQAGLARFESLARLGTADASVRGLRDLVAGAVQIVVHVARYGDGVVRVAAISELDSLTGDGFAVREFYRFQSQVATGGPAKGRFVATGETPRFYEELAARGLPAGPDLDS